MNRTIRTRSYIACTIQTEAQIESYIESYRRGPGVRLYGSRAQGGAQRCMGVSPLLQKPHFADWCTIVRLYEIAPLTLLSLAPFVQSYKCVIRESERRSG
jgi:hypothetical protein